MKTQKLKVTLNEVRRMQELAGIVPLNENTDVDSKLKEFGNEKVIELKDTMDKKGLRLYYQLGLGGKEYKYKAPVVGSGWDAKEDGTSANSFIYWNGEKNGVILVGIDKTEQSKATSVLKFAEDSFSEDYDIKKGMSGDWLEIRMTPKNR
jgi:hypothetical protein